MSASVVPGQLYLASPQTSTNGDVHGANWRPCAVVELSGRTVRTVTRTTQQPSRDERAIASDVNPSIGLSKPGWWTDRNQRPLLLIWLENAEMCKYLGVLAPSETENLLDFWRKTKMLGRENL